MKTFGVAADSIVGVSLFSESAPEDFCAFNRAFIAMFRITAGETWVESLPKLDPDGICSPFLYLYTQISSVFHMQMPD